MKNDIRETKRDDDIDINLPMFKFKGSAKSLASFLNGIFGVIALIIVMLWHDYKSDKFDAAVQEALWFQTLTLATPQEHRVVLLKNNKEKMPPALQPKVSALKEE